MQDAFFIVGSTAVGKTGLAVEVAARVGAEIVSADAYQVYRGFDLLTAKPTPQQQRQVAHHLVGCVDPAETYNVARFLNDATQAIERVTRTGRPVIVVGGNGLYVKALTHGLSPLPPADARLRAELERLPTTELLTRLEQLDPATWAKIDRQNPRRLVRALEVCLLTGQPFSGFQQAWNEAAPVINPSGVFIHCDRDKLVARIGRRVENMFALGVIDEVRRCAHSPLSATAQQILGLDQIQAYLAKQLDLADCKTRIEIATRQYAKRQMTWFKRETCFAPVQRNADSDERSIVEQIHHHFQAWQARISDARENCRSNAD